MRIVIAPDSFKGSLTAVQAAEAMAAGVKRIFPQAELELVPMADGVKEPPRPWLWPPTAVCAT